MLLCNCVLLSKTPIRARHRRMKRLQSFSAGRRSGIPCSDSIAIFTGTDEHCATVCVVSRRAEGRTPAYDAAYRRRAVLQGQVASVSCFRPVPSCYLSRAGRLAGAMSSPVSCVHPVACGEASAPGCTRPPVFFCYLQGNTGRRQNRRSAVAQASAPWLMLGVER